MDVGRVKIMIYKVFIFFVLTPLVLGILGEELFRSNDEVLTPILLAISLLGAISIFIVNYRSTKKIPWYFVGSLFVIINSLLLYLFYNFRPGF